MNAEQKQRAAELLAAWRATTYALHADRMADLLQELVDASRAAPENAKWRLGDLVQKVRGSKWRGKVVGFYSTEATPIGYSVESAFEPGSVQVWPEAALIEWDGAK